MQSSTWDSANKISNPFKHLYLEKKNSTGGQMITSLLAKISQLLQHGIGSWTKPMEGQEVYVFLSKGGQKQITG